MSFGYFVDKEQNFYPIVQLDIIRGVKIRTNQPQRFQINIHIWIEQLPFLVGYAIPFAVLILKPRWLVRLEFDGCLMESYLFGSIKKQLSAVNACWFDRFGFLIGVFDV